MEQQTLRAWEQRCTQEEPPKCQAACPLHVDVRAFMAAMQQGKWKEARAVLARTMPLPGVLGLVCEQPCQTSCRRADLDEALRIGDLERAAIRLFPQREAIRPLPAKNVQVAILGAGLSALTCAWDLGKKGYTPVLHAPAGEWGGLLRDIPEDLLPSQALEDAFAQLAGLRVQRVEAPALNRALLDQLSAKFSVVYVGLDTPSLAGGPASLGLEPPAAVTWQSAENTFCGGFQTRTCIDAAFQGRMAAVSMDRFLQKVSLTAARDREGPFETTLFTSIEGLPTQAAAPVVWQDADTVRAEAGRCLLCECKECVKVCVYLEQFKGYPKKYARELYNNLSIIQGLRKANTMIESCSGCGLCEAVCPGDFHMGRLCLEARQEMVRTNKMPGSAYDFAVRDFEASVSDQAALLRHAPGADSSAYLFMPGCQLAGSSPAMVQRVYGHLRDRLPEPAGLLLSCCGAPVKWAGQQARFDAHLQALEQSIIAMGSPTIIAACTTCIDTFREHLPAVKWISMWEILETHPPEAAPVNRSFSLHDPCTARHLEPVRGAVRRLADRCGLALHEPRLSGELTECCGFGGGMESANPALADTVARTRASRCEGDILAWCAMCRDSLSRSGKTVHHLLDFLFPEAAEAPVCATCSYIRRGPGGPDRQENRRRLKRDLLAELWQERAAMHEDTSPVQLAPEVRDMVDQRRILLSDIRAALRHARETGRELTNQETGRRLVCHAPGTVTYWVEYSIETTHMAVYRIHRAWSHRMAISEV
ncbi:putative 4Fe-4S ferredoxin iron-sulfur binding domain-containing protein [Megalodesulfovibrio gigas DSM 1382 = ATCC 19364]|uniref:Putative 4Fe-4S ferredoxin iron-sulfur binding domain-containing protein n=2 Tax=Megalodesulfovibrio gigas TaxID=879 RepID=T2G880_MEGG1|nr:pyridine nucleotide-disulfide oxidoreductase/dicluster-binding protein [Megalodesulfovibrio gigas]AGW12795.1 putative 4Fe-4S ferredoxin iron-sulfur binding domain-containing protein [Megalodesulfovibrio gigas DSM 1382 = ATCC 19364]